MNVVVKQVGAYQVSKVKNYKDRRAFVHIFLFIYSDTGSSFFMLVVLQEGSKAARQPGVGLAGGGSSKS